MSIRDIIIWKSPEPAPEVIPAALPRCGCCHREIKAETYHHVEFMGLGFNVCPVCLKKWKRRNTEKEMEDIRK